MSYPSHVKQSSSLWWPWGLASCVALVYCAYFIQSGEGQERADSLQSIPSANIEPLNQGPIHEAFAKPIAFDSKASTEVIAKAPPANVEEIPPEIQPQGKNVEWIPGYWDWEESRKDFIWVSGIWRDAPPGKRWVPGYWATVDGGYQWTSGLWVDADVEVLSYLPHPPDSLEEGPNTAAPDDDSFWVPGCWRWNDNRYAWRAGYWSRGYNNWLWTPDHYCYTPRGSVFCRGYWDYGLERRGWLFAPVAFRGGYYNRGYYYTPRNLVDAALLTAALFIGPNHRHYYYGDFYGRRGYEPWFAWHLGGRGYDPFFAHDYGRNRDWYDRLARDFRDGRKDGGAGRRSYEDIANDINRFRRERGEPVVDRKTSLVRPLDKAIDQRRDRDQIVRVEESQRRAAASASQGYRSLTQGRLDGEGKDRSDLRAGKYERSGDGERGRAEVAVPVPKDYQPRQFRLPERQPSDRAVQSRPAPPRSQPTTRDRDNSGGGRRYEVQRPNNDGGSDREGDRGGSRDGAGGRASRENPGTRGGDGRRNEVQRPNIDRGSGNGRGGASRSDRGGSRDSQADSVRGGSSRSSSGEGDRGGASRGGGEGSDRGGVGRGNATDRGGGDRGGGGGNKGKGGRL